MKRILLITLIATIVGASCTSTKNGMFNKRKYTKGFFVDTKGRAPKVKEGTQENVARTSAVKVMNSVPVQVVSASSSEAPVLTAEAANTDHKTTAQSQKKSGFAYTTNHSQPVGAQAKAPFKELKMSAKAIKTFKGAKGSDTDTIILVILCLFPFINLIAIFLKDNKAITLNFWVTLILDILFFLPGIIFALLVVLDIVNLA